MLIFQHHVPRNTAGTTSPLQHDTRQPKTGLPQNYDLLLAPPRPDVARSSLKSSRSQSSVGRSTSSKHPRITRLLNISACQDVPCGRYSRIIQYYDEMHLRVNWCSNFWSAVTIVEALGDYIKSDVTEIRRDGFVLESSGGGKFRTRNLIWLKKKVDTVLTSKTTIWFLSRILIQRHNTVF